MLFVLFMLLLVSAFCLLFLPPLRAHCHLLCREHIILSMLTMAFTFSFYLLSSHPFVLNQWLKYGQPHYQLLMEYEQLGGINGIIFKIKRRLAKNPNDRQGWLILGKLYKYKHDNKAAEKAFQRAHTY